MMADKDMKLSDILEKIANRCGQALQPQHYFFRSLNTSRRAQTVSPGLNAAKT